ncbi:MAG TPA: hypothetical protein VML55_15580, partial [Planctomycetaceae bacterium]|nr:hypothetical protein [Planctomycetaceae bacterium]
MAVAGVRNRSLLAAAATFFLVQGTDLPGEWRTAPPRAAVTPDEPAVEPAAPADSDDDVPVHAAGLQQPLEPVPAPPSILAPATLAPPESQRLAAAIFGTDGLRRSLLAEARQQRATGPSTDVLLGGEGRFRATTDAGSLLGKSTSALGVATQSRTPIVTDPRVRASRTGPLLASGSYWFPARQDLDTLLSKIDSRIVEDMIVIKGPYAVRYGPGFDFIDFELLGSPRYECGYETHGSTSFDYQTNGEQWYGRQSFWGGDANWGYRVGSGHR